MTTRKEELVAELAAIYELEKSDKISSSLDANAHLYPMLSNKDVEHFYILALNRANHVIKAIKISEGGQSGTVADPKVIFREALKVNAAAIILGHNHPSGNTNPSESDKSLTLKMRKAGEYLDMPVLDHLIVTDAGYFSFADNGLL